MLHAGQVRKLVNKKAFEISRARMADYKQYLDRPLPKLNLQGIDWVIVGGESGRKARTMKEECALDIMDQCRASDVKFFCKQWGGTNKKKAGRT